MITKKRLFWATAEGWLGYFFQIVTYAFLARSLEAKDLGLYTLCMSIFAFCRSSIYGAVIETAIFYKNKNGFYSSFFYFLLFLLFIFSSGLLLLAAIIQKYFHFQQFLFCMILLVVSFIPFLLSLLPEALCVQNLAFDQLAKRKITENIIGGLSGIFFCIAGFGVFSLFAQSLASSITGAFLIFRYYPYIPREFSLTLLNTRFRKYFFGRLLGSFIANVNTKIDTFIVGLTLGQAAVGFYGLAQRLTAFLGAFSSPIVNRLGFPALSILKDKNDLGSAFLKLNNLSLYLNCFLYFLFFCIADEFQNVFFGEKWSPCVPLIKILILSGFLLNSSNIILVFLRAQGFVRYDIIFALFLSVSTIFWFAFLSSYGLFICSMGALMSAFTSLPYLLLKLKKHENLVFFMFLKSFYKPLIATLFSLLGASFGKYLIVSIGFFNNFTLLFVSALFYCVSFWAFVYFFHKKIFFFNE